MGPLNDESKLQVDEKKNKTEKKMKPNNIKNIKTNRYDLAAKNNIIHTILN